MFLPSKNVSTDRALLTLGGQILLQLDRPGTVSAVWDRLQDWRAEQEITTNLPFAWFAYALDGLYVLGAIELVDDVIQRTRNAA